MSVTIVDLVESPQGGGHEQGSSQAQSLRRQISSSKVRWGLHGYLVSHGFRFF